MVVRMNGSSSTFMKKSLFCSVALSCFALRTIGQTTAPPPATAAPQRAAEVDRRGDLGMGFGHDMTSHRKVSQSTIYRRPAKTWGSGGDIRR